MFFRRSAALGRLLALGLLLLLLSGCAGSAEPEESGPAAPAVSAALPSPPTPRELPPYPPVEVYFDGLLTDRGYLVEGALYLSPEAVSGFFGEELRATVSEDGLLLTGDGLELYAVTGQEYMQANGRYLYTPSGFFVADGRVYLPADAVERILGVSALIRSEEPMQVEIAGDGVHFPEGGEDYYTLHFPEEDLFWLSRIINAESKREPLAGMIGVGNVVLNRVASDRFPSTIYDVIYDRQYTIQFEPIETGGVLDTPEELPTIAACLCLEGYNTVGDSLFFVNPDKGVSPWFEEELTPTVVIGLHHFYTG